MGVCSVSTCTVDMQTRRGMCSKHYKRWMAHGCTEPTNTVGMNADEVLRFHGWTVTQSGCWEWAGDMHGRGYGRARVLGVTHLAHRLAYETWVGPIPEGHVVRHKCDNPPCINPEHLETGTVSDNTQDMLRRGRHKPPQGEKNGNALLDEGLVREIRRRYAAGEGSYASLAPDYGVSASLIARIVTRTRWDHVK